VTLRLRLTVALVAIVAVGLIVSDIATYTSLRSFLLQRIDQQLKSSPRSALIIAGQPDDLHGGDLPSGGEPLLPTGTYVFLFDPSGEEVAKKPITYGGAVPRPPLLPGRISPGTEDDPSFLTVRAEGGPSYRAAAARFNDGPATGYSIVVAIPLTEMQQTLGRLLVVAGLVTASVLAAMGALSLWTVRRGLRPLERIERTAEAIAGGDLTRRVDDTDARTEVGRLGSSLNVMLGRIEEAMEERRASEEALRRFLADASHELRTPLTSIRGYAELFRRGADSDPADTALAMRRIEQEGERMGELVDDLLFLARAGGGRPIAHERLDLARVAADTVHDAGAVDPSREIGLEGPTELIVSGDDRRLRQVFANLLSNTLMHTPAGTEVTVRLAEDKGWATIEVSDEGPGLASEDTLHVFEPFYRADPSRERVRADGEGEGQGTGLGLAIVAAIADAHGGSAGVESEPGHGATFTVRVPTGVDGANEKDGSLRAPGLE
jgi:two-component system, OmpR family, sensor kinase